MMFNFFKTVDPKVDAFIEACASNKLDVVQNLMAQKVDINDTDEVGDTGLSQAALHGHLGIVQFLLTKQVSPYSKNHALLFACQKGHTAIVDLLLKAGADCNTYMDGYHTPLFQVIVQNQPKVFERLLEDKNINVNLEDKMGIIPLHLAAYNGRFEMAEKLIKQNADPKQANKEGWTVAKMTDMYFEKIKKKQETNDIPVNSFCNEQRSMRRFKTQEVNL